MVRKRLGIILAMVVGGAGLAFIPAASSADHAPYPDPNQAEKPEKCQKEIDKHEEKSDKRDEKIAKGYDKDAEHGHNPPKHGPKEEEKNEKKDAKEQEKIQKKCASQ